jgi:hypothetical protein
VSRSLLDLTASAAHASGIRRWLSHPHAPGIKQGLKNGTLTGQPIAS